MTTIDHLPITTVARTIVDLAAVLSAAHLGRVVEGCLVEEKVDWGSLADTFAKLARRGKPGVHHLRAVLARLEPGIEASESVLESGLLGLLRAAGLPPPVQQLPLPWRTRGIGRVDFAYRDQRLIIEADGRRWHTRAEAFEADRRRDNLAMLAGWRVLRFTWKDLEERPDAVVTMVEQALCSSSAAGRIG